ncbi:LuxR C-terminal-related transcriptional regulator [Escherichia marmotae]|nr:LuxR C-terminal-related transcriptional regulator [Escherichia marmotae]
MSHAGINSASTAFDKPVQIIIFLYGGVSSVLTGIKKLVHVFNTVSFEEAWPDVLFLGDIPQQWLYNTLRHQLPKPALDHLRFINSRLFFYELKNHKYHFNITNFPLLKNIKDTVSLSHSQIRSGLTSREFDVLYGYYNGLSVKVMADLYKLAISTIYFYRRSALKKIQLMKGQQKKYRRMFWADF